MKWFEGSVFALQSLRLSPDPTNRIQRTRRCALHRLPDEATVEGAAPSEPRTGRARDIRAFQRRRSLKLHATMALWRFIHAEGQELLAALAHRDVETHGDGGDPRRGAVLDNSEHDGRGHIPAASRIIAVHDRIHQAVRRVVHAHAAAAAHALAVGQAQVAQSSSHTNAIGQPAPSAR